jgi:hypothetical protein
MPMLLPNIAVVASFLVGVGAAIAEGGIAWIGALMLIGASLGWLLLVRQIANAGSEREGGKAPRRRPRPLPTPIITVVAGVIILGALAGYLG